MKVVHLMASLRPSGMERMLVSGAPYFHRAGITSVVVGQGIVHPFGDQLSEAGYRVATIPPVKSLKGPAAWAALLRKERPHVVHIHTEEVFAASVRIAKRAAPEARLVRTLHGYFLAEGWWGLKRRVQALASDGCVDSFVALSAEMADHEETFGRECVVIPNWVDDRYLGEHVPIARDVDLVLVGNCEQVKNHGLVLGLARERGWSVAHVGDEQHAEFDEVALLDELEADGLLRFRGVGDPLDVLHRARTFTMPSEREGFSVALAEALAVGLPCVASDVTGIQWARKYPAVTMVMPGNAAAWASAVEAALDGEAINESPAKSQIQRDLARTQLSAEVGVRRHLELYQGRSGR